ncbi:SlyX family protein [Thiohalocapsa marina]|uniref:SlyX family protein n=1 Tax=Thiohalocapsa marina TaxID=424902 RepID=A0A5M8FP34_9GAMM|nr:SlyX family protein [Thiohalocapsa marina]KAA6182682.1 SlyX family protein [Thiohalocapsa marina]
MDEATHQLRQLNEAIAELQMRLTYQEDEIQHLNRVQEQQRTMLQEQAARIEALNRLTASLAQGLREHIPDAPPPHY